LLEKVSIEKKEKEIALKLTELSERETAVLTKEKEADKKLEGIKQFIDKIK